MAIRFLGHFPPDETRTNYCLPHLEPENVEPYTPLITLEEAMYIWWGIAQVRYTYSWDFSRTQEGLGTLVTVSGSGSVVMSGGFDTMSEKKCPQIIYFSCGQDVVYTSDIVPPTNITDTAILSIDSRPYRYEEFYVPVISLQICGGRNNCYASWQTTASDLGDSGSVNFFNLFTMPLFPTQSKTYGEPGESITDIYGVSISLSVEKESEGI